MTFALPFDDAPPPAGHPERFGGRWRLVGAGLSNVWRYGDLELEANSGRLLLRGPNGTGKTTALEALWPYLLDLNAALLSAGKARTTSLSGLMQEGAERRRIGYLWLSFAGPGNNQVVSYGVRLNFSKGSSPQVRVAPFTVPGRPLHELSLWGPSRAALSADAFADAVGALGGIVFDDTEGYVRDLATRLFSAEPRELVALAARIRAVRNPALLGELSANRAADALRESLPGVSEEEIEATGEALADSEATRVAFERDRDAAGILEDFARVWSGHVVEVVGASHARAEGATQAVRDLTRRLEGLTRKHETALADVEREQRALESLRTEHRSTKARQEAIERSTQYQAAGQLKELEEVLAVQARAATQALGSLETAADAARRIHEQTLRQADDLAADLAAVFARVTQIDPELAGSVPVAVHQRPRGVLVVGERSVDPGPTLDVQVDDRGLDGAVSAWSARARQCAARADGAKVHLSAHRQVAQAEQRAQQIRREADQAAQQAEARGAEARRCEEAARAAATTLRSSLVGWRGAVPADTDPGWAGEDLDDIDWTTPSAALAAADHLGERTTTWAHQQAATARARAAALGEEATGLREKVAELRAAAADLRNTGARLPLPRPEWAGPGDDARALGSALTWAPGVPAPAQDLVEAALAAAGVLGATVDDATAGTPAWSVRATGPIATSSLAALLRAEPEHPLAGTAQAVLARIALRPSAADLADPDPTAALVIGLDGSFRAGVLRGQVGAAPDAAPGDGQQGARRVPPAQHIGAARRRAAALRRADELDHQADELDHQADGLEEGAARHEETAAAVLAALRQLPTRGPLRNAEATRAAAATAHVQASADAADAERRAAGADEEAAAAQSQWVAAVSAAGLPPDAPTLRQLAEDTQRAADRLLRAAGEVTERLRPRLLRLVTTTAEAPGAELADLAVKARKAHETSATAKATYDALLQEAGTDAADALERYQAATAQLGDLDTEIEAADTRLRACHREEAAAAARVEEAEREVDAAAPVARAAADELRRLLAVEGVAEVVLGPGVTAASGLDRDDGTLLAQIADGLAGKPTSARRTLRERHDTARAALAGIWALDPGIDHAELDTYVLTHRDAAYTPVTAATEARRLAEQAESALNAAQEKALHDFVVGRLPAAINTAWTRLQDWREDVNAKMKAASASSGVGVSVRIAPSSDLAPAARTVFDLTCKSGDALRLPEAKAEAGAALRQLIDASDSDDMVVRVRDAVDIRSWVDVTYLVTRPGQDPKPWNSRTGLSGGERRLVVLAPMLAAVAAAYDKFAATAPRLAALDEVPAEVDEQGREGLARYVADLDLDLIATSYLWDGAPGAWDGVDAHELDAGPDGTVVAFPMIVRGPEPLPGDELDGSGL